MKRSARKEGKLIKDNGKDFGIGNSLVISLPDDLFSHGIDVNLAKLDCKALLINNENCELNILNKDNIQYFSNFVLYLFFFFSFVSLSQCIVIVKNSMASHTLLRCNFCSDFASHCEVCRICPRHSAYCSCSNQINNHTSALSFSNVGVKCTLDNLNCNLDNLYESLFLNCQYHNHYIVSINEYLDLNNSRLYLFLIHFNVRSLQKNFNKLTNYWVEEYVHSSFIFSFILQ